MLQRLTASAVPRLLLVLALFVAGCQQQNSEDLGPMTREGRLAPLLDNLGELHREVTTSDPMAQRYFDQGLTLLYGFNHAEAKRSFEEAARIDPECLMAYWGQAMATGPNLNDPEPDSEREQEAFEIIQQASQHKDSGSALEQAMVDALATRFSANKGEDRAALNLAYAKAMTELQERNPEDPDLGVLTAGALMNTTPWDYWIEGGSPKPGTEGVVPILESVLESTPDHPGANHFYIHATEASLDPDRAVAAADRLGSLVPGAGHLVHMPSHIYIRVGRYQDGSEANKRAIAADEDYITQCRAQGIYPAAYYPHNIHFLTATLAMEGKSKEMLAAARKVAAQPDEAAYCMPGFGFPHLLRAQPYFAMVRFGEWDAVLAEPELPADQIFAGAVWHYARGLALLAKGDTAAAELEREVLQKLMVREELAELKIWETNALTDLATIAHEVLAGELAAKAGDYDQAVQHLQKAISVEDALTYSEPPDWPIPVRQNLGAVLLAAGRAADAEKVYLRDLQRHRNNGWGLAGLANSLEAQGRTAEAAKARTTLAQVWNQADVELQSSRF